MKPQDKQLLASLVAFGVVIALFGVIILANEQNQRLLEEKHPCSKYEHLNESMQPMRCWKEGEQ